MESGSLVLPLIVLTLLAKIGLFVHGNITEGLRQGKFGNGGPLELTGLGEGPNITAEQGQRFHD
jgi:hypothetical protein